MADATPVTGGGARDKSHLLDEMMKRLAEAKKAEAKEALLEADGPWFFITWPKVEGMVELQAATCGEGYIIRDPEDHQTWFVDKAEFDELYERNQADRWDIK